jgi:hypothetical protein
MEKRKIGALIIVLGLMVGAVTGITNNIRANTQVSHAEGDFGGIRKVVPDYAGRDPAVEAPYSFVYNPAANSPQYQWYKQLASWTGIKEVRFYEELYRGQFLWYSKSPPYNAKDYDKDMTTMYENKLRVWGIERSDWAVDRDYSLNLKTGRSEPGKQNYTPNGTTYMVSGPYEGKYLEWRYLGYGFDGTPVSNPYFPPDITPEKWEPWLKNWVETPWNHGWTEETDFDRSEKKVQWFMDYFFAENPNFRRPSMTLRADATDWASKFTLQTDPTKSTGIVTGFHKVNGHVYYATLLMKTPPKPNLRMVEYSVYDKKTGKLIGKQTLDPNNNVNADGSSLVENRTYYDENGKVTNKAFVEHGKTYVIKAKVKNMIVKDLAGKDTTYTPIRLNQNYAYDLKSQEYGAWDETYANSVTTTKRETTIKYGTTVDFSNQVIDGKEETWEYTVPPTVEKEIVFQSEIVEGFKKKDENTRTDDDVGRLRFYIEPEDIGTSNDALLINQDGIPVENVVPNRTYSLRFYVDKVLGRKVVGDPNDKDNPYASLEVVVSDKKTSKTITAVAKEVLTPQGKRIAIDVPNAITPQTSIIEAKWQIPQKHRDNNQSTNPANDGPYSKTWASNINISVSNLSIKASSFVLPVGQNTTNETMTFSFDIFNENKENQDKDIDVVIKKGGQVIWSNIVYVPANKNYTVPVVTVPGVNLSKGENVFTVEVNPQPRKWYEFLKDATSPSQVYEDNITANSVMVHSNTGSSNCQILNNQNTWTTTHYINEWHGYRDSWYHEVDGSGHWHSDCVITSDTYWNETISYYERYQITNVFFRSKLTKDQAIRDGGGDGWVDLVNGKVGEVKAGYGFEIKYVVKYQTNVYSASPKPWSSDCSGKTVSSTHGSYVDAPNTIQVTMPFTDTSGQLVKYTLNASSESGSWDNLTQNFEMPTHNAFNIKDTKEVFINTTAKDGDYPLRIDTYTYFYGSYDKPSKSTYLCDYKIVTIRIKGSSSDDVKSHLTQ